MFKKGNTYGAGNSNAVGNTYTQTHGMKKRMLRGTDTSRMYWIWAGIKQRCCNPRNKRYPLYGGRGITMCDAWKNSAEQFVSDMGQRPSPKHSVDRIDNDGPYSPANCRWASQKEQAGNSRRWSGNTLEVDGVQKNLSQWSIETGVSARLITDRIRRGWEPKLAISLKPDKARHVVERSSYPDRVGGLWVSSTAGKSPLEYRVGITGGVR